MSVTDVPGRPFTKGVSVGMEEEGRKEERARKTKTKGKGEQYCKFTAVENSAHLYHDRWHKAREKNTPL